MRNRAKCKLCNEIIESYHRYDFVTCKCGEISIDGGRDELHCGAKDWDNFLRVDDEGNEIAVKVQQSADVNKKTPPLPIQDLPPTTRKERIEMFESMIKNLENLPKHALDLPINHYDLYSFMLVILEILKSKK